MMILPVDEADGSLQLHGLLASELDTDKRTDARVDITRIKLCKFCRIHPYLCDPIRACDYEYGQRLSSYR